MDYGLVLGASTALVWSVGAVAAKPAARGGTRLSSLLIGGGGTIPILVLFLLYPSGIGMAGLALSLLSGIAGLAGNIFFYKSLETEQASNSYGTVVVQSVLIGLFGVLLLGNPLSVLEVIGSIVGIVGVMMVSASKGLRINRLLIPAILGNAAWAVQWGICAYAIKYFASTLPVLAISRSLTAIPMLILFLATPRSMRWHGLKRTERGRVLWTGISSGILSGIGTLFLGYLAAVGNFALGGILTSFIPVIVAVVTYFTFGERLSKIQGAGIVIACIGAAAIAA